MWPFSKRTNPTDLIIKKILDIEASSDIERTEEDTFKFVEESLHSLVDSGNIKTLTKEEITSLINDHYFSPKKNKKDLVDHIFNHLRFHSSQWRFKRVGSDCCKYYYGDYCIIELYDEWSSSKYINYSTLTTSRSRIGLSKSQFRRLHKIVVALECNQAIQNFG